MSLWVKQIFCWARRLLGRKPSEPHAMGEVECVNCGHEAVVVISTSSPYYDAETGAFDMLECSACGKFTMCSK